VFRLDDGKTGVVVISTFDTTAVVVPSDIAPGDANEYQKLTFLNESIKAFKTVNRYSTIQ